MSYSFVADVIDKNYDVITIFQKSYFNKNVAEILKIIIMVI